MGVCSPSCPLPAVLHAPTALGGARGDVCVAALSGGTVTLYTVVSETFPWTPKPPGYEGTPFLTLETVLMLHAGFLTNIYHDSRPAVKEAFCHPHRPAALCKVGSPAGPGFS